MTTRSRKRAVPAERDMSFVSESSPGRGPGSPVLPRRPYRCTSSTMVPRGTVLSVAMMTLREFRDGAGRVLEAIERTHEPVIITKYERPVAVLIGIDEWEELEAYRDRKDSAAVARSRDEGQFVPLAAALESLGVDPREIEALRADRGRRRGSVTAPVVGCASVTTA